ncbi:MAG TPA: 4-hydroxybenzoate 3-monooxygenase [Candidatus Binataceae bacterium]|nr:4-hydroxybenzoate 3-monooxygenase [Candidatus Binataceae bacterium]
MRTQVGIVGAGPAGLMLAHLLHRGGIESVVIEARSRRYVQERVRAGVLEQGTVDLMTATGVGERLKREGLVHRGIELRFACRSHRIDLSELTGGAAITIYGQNEVIKDLTDARLAAGAPIYFESKGVSPHGFDGAEPAIRFTSGGAEHEVRCDFIAGCDGFHGVCRPSIPAGALTIYERVYPFAWLGILAAVAPSSDELIYSRHERGFALHSMRSPELTRLYLQCAPDGKLDDWPDDRIWDELDRRFEIDGGWTLRRGPITQKGITEMRSFVAEPMQCGRMFLAGDAAHIVPPTGAKGLNLAIADVRVLARALAEFFSSGDRAMLDGYSQTCLRRVWKVQRFSWWMTSILHRLDGGNAFDARRQMAELDYVTGSRAAAQSLAENYVGLPMES